VAPVRIATPLFHIRRRLAGHRLAGQVVGSVLLVRASSPLWSDPPWQATLTFASLAGPGLLLVIGLWTPLAGMAVAAIELSRIFTSDDLFASVLAATMGRRWQC
jgi:hypothetical protein